MGWSTHSVLHLWNGTLWSGPCLTKLSTPCSPHVSSTYRPLIPHPSCVTPGCILEVGQLSATDPLMKNVRIYKQWCHMAQFPLAWFLPSYLILGTISGGKVTLLPVFNRWEKWTEILGSSNQDVLASCLGFYITSVCTVLYNFDFQTTEEEILISMDLISFLNTLYSILRCFTGFFLFWNLNVHI